DQAMSRGPMVPHYRSYWMQSVVQAIAAEALCRQVADENPSEYFLCGLLVDIGRLAMLKTVPNEYRGVLETAREEQRPLIEVEREQLGIDHVDVSIRLMENWKLAESLVEAVRSHHLPADELQTHRASPHFALLKAIGIAAAVGDYFCATAKGEALQ